MKKIFRFSDQESFRSNESTEFAEIVLKSPAVIKTRLAKSFGLSIKLDSDPIRVSHNGRKIGIGSFLSPSDGEIHFSIYPKVNTLVIRKLFQALATNRSIQRNIHFDDTNSKSSVEGNEDDFSPVFLLKLLEEIVSSSIFLSNSWHKKKHITVKGGVKGRPLVHQFLKNIVSGKGTSITCEVLENEGLKDYAIILLETAQSINTLLDEWYELMAVRNNELRGKIKLLNARFKIHNSPNFNRSLLYRICRPPFPYGLKNVLYKCLKYWQWRNHFKIVEHGKIDANYFNLAIDLDILFEVYVGEVWRQSINEDFEILDSPEYTYKVSQLNEIIKEGSIIPDYLLFNRKKKTLFVIDAKYRTDVAARDQVYQVISYLEYQYSEFRNFENFVGLLIYPSEYWQIEKIIGFSKEIYCVRMPVTEQLEQTQILLFLQNVIESFFRL